MFVEPCTIADVLQRVLCHGTCTAEDYTFSAGVKLSVSSGRSLESKY